MDRFARTVLGYHGCDPAFAEALLDGRISIDEWKPSTNDYDWLGHGIYFWEYAPERASNWTNQTITPRRGVIGAIIQLGNCLDFTDIKDTQLLRESFETLQSDYAQEHIRLPINQNGRNILDCLVIEELTNNAEANGTPFQTVRCPFVEGVEAYPGSMIRTLSHVQLVVKNPVNILGVFRPNLSDHEELP